MAEKFSLPLKRWGIIGKYTFMNNILVLADFTPVSVNAEEYAASLAKINGDELHLLHIYKDLIPVTVGPEPWTITVSKKQKANEALVNKEVKFLEEKYSVKITGDIKKIFTGNSVIKAIKETQAHLIVTGVKHRENHKLPGSSIFRLLRKVGIPVLFIPDGVVFTRPKNIVLAVDFNEEVDSTLFEPLFSIIEKFNAYLRVLHIQERGADIDPSELEGKLKLGYILSKANYLYDKVESDDVEAGILQYVKNHPADILVMTARNHSIAEQISKPLLTSSLIHKIRLPILVLNNN